MDDWKPFNGGESIGETGSEGGKIILDDEHPDGARITIEHLGQTAPFAITCGVYGWLVHTRFFANDSEALQACAEMKPALAELARSLNIDDLDIAGAACADFVARFP